MSTFFAEDFSFSQAGYTLAKLGIAAALVLPIGWNRQTSARSLGLRTFPLVAVASCAYVLLGTAVFGSNGQAEARVIQGLIAGIGFLGGGAIVKEGTSVSGTSTAASIWSTAALGAAVAWGRFDIAVSLAVLNFVTLWGLKEAHRAINREDPDKVPAERESERKHKRDDDDAAHDGGSAQPSPASS